MSSTAPHPAEPGITPAQILQALMVSCIYPLLQNKRTGPLDPAMAHAAAIEVLKSFHIRDTWELFIHTQAITFGLAALDSLGLSMTPALSPAMVLRCRGNANALQRTSDRSRRALDEHRAAVEARRAREAARAQAPDLADIQAAAHAQIAETERLLAAARARANQPPSNAPAPTAAAAPTTRDDLRPAAHAIPATSLGTPPAAAPLANAYRADVLSSTASYLATQPYADEALPPMSPPRMEPGLPLS